MRDPKIKSVVFGILVPGMSSHRKVKVGASREEDYIDEGVKRDDLEVADNKEDAGVETPWDEPFEVQALPGTLVGQLHHLAPFLLGRLTADYDEDFFHLTLGLSNSGYKFSDLNSNKFCKKSSLLEKWPERSSGRHYVADCEDGEAVRTYLQMHRKIYGGDPDNGTFGTSFLRACHLFFEEGKDVNFAQKAEVLQKAREKQAARNPMKLSPSALRKQIEVIIDFLAGHIPGGAGNKDKGAADDESPGCQIVGATTKAVKTSEVKRVRARRSLVAPAKNVEEKKRKPPSDANTEKPLVATDPKQVLEQQRLKKKSLEAALMKVEANRERVKTDLANQRAFMTEKEEEESKFYEDVAVARAASKKAAATGNDAEKRRFDQMARLGQDKLALASRAAKEAQTRIDRVLQKLAEMEADEEKHHAEIDAMATEISSLELASAFLRLKKVLAWYPWEFQVLPIALNDPCPFCERYFIDTCCVPLTCGCLAHPHCMFEVVFSQDAHCRRCERGMTGGWLGQWGFELDAKAMEELRITEEILMSEPASPRAGSKLHGGNKRPAPPIVPMLSWKKPKVGAEDPARPSNAATKRVAPAKADPCLLAHALATPLLLPNARRSLNYYVPTTPH